MQWCRIGRQVAKERGGAGRWSEDHETSKTPSLMKAIGSPTTEENTVVRGLWKRTDGVGHRLILSLGMS